MAKLPESRAPENPDKQGWTLRGRLLVALTVALLPVAVVIILQGLERSRLDTENVRERLIQSARAAATEEQNLTASAEQLLRAVSHIADVRDVTRDCSTVLSDALRGVTYFLNIARLNAQGMVVCSALREAIGRDASTNPVFSQLSKSGDKLAIGDLQMSTILDQPVIAAMLPIYDRAGQFDGGVSAVLNVRWVDYMMRSADIPDEAVIAVFDRNSAIVSSNNPTVSKDLFSKALSSDIREGEWFSGEDSSGQNWSYAVAGLGNAVFVGFAMPDEQLFSQTYIHMGIDFILPFAMIGVAWVAIWIATERQITQWIYYLRRVAAAYRSGHYAIRPQLHGAPEEFTLLGDAMSDMAAAIQDRDRRLREAIGTKSVLIKEIHHRVKNNLQIVMSLLSLQATHVDDSAAREALLQAQTRINALALVHRILNDIEDQTTVDVKRLLDELSRQIAEGMGFARSGRIVTDVIARQFPGSVAVPVALFTVEALTNIYKHAYPEPKGGLIRVSLQRVEGRKLKLSIEDDGVGFAPSSGGRSIGSRLIQTFGRQLGGESMVRSRPGQGTIVEVVFPEPAESADQV